MSICPNLGAFDAGATVEFRITLSVDDVLTDATAVTLTLRRPDGANLTAGAVTHVSTGVYEVDYTFAADFPGQWFFRWESTGPAAGVKEGSVVIRPSHVLV